MNLTNTLFAPLATHLLDLMRKLEGSGVEPTLVGGFGLLLRREWIAHVQANTLFQNIPEARSTEDFDLLLSLEILADRQKSTALKEALQNLGYEVIPNARNFQFKKAHTAWGHAREVKIDLLAPQPPQNDEALVEDWPRVKWRSGGSPLHGRVTPEAIAAEERRMPVTLNGHCSDEQFYSGQIWLPNPLTYYVMKLFAFQDNLPHEHDQTVARKHAGDLYTLTGILRQQDYDDALELVQQYKDSPQLNTARQIVNQHFGEANSTGILRLKEQLDTNTNDLNRFIEVLGAIFDPPA